ncbi:MAG: type II toxin-antitoxin system RelE/ParE family toxin [Aquificales bacterium]|nr:type II toxin-antitoxin system RelE/ParE family toxin [Aquificales bacterium]
MKILKTRLFHKWARKEGLPDTSLRQAIEEMEQGLIDANLGGSVYKKRIAVRGQGKRGSVRTIIAFKVEDSAFFIYGFAKNKQGNVGNRELKALKRLARELFNYSAQELSRAIEAGELFEVN